MRRTGTALLVVATITLFAVTGMAIAARGWRVVAHSAARGEFATTATDATINHPRQIAVRLRGGSGDITWACDRGFSVSSWGHSFNRGFHRLPHVRGKDSCDVTASVGGSGRVEVQILKR